MKYFYCYEIFSHIIATWDILALSMHHKLQYIKKKQKEKFHSHEVEGSLNREIWVREMIWEGWYDIDNVGEDIKVDRQRWCETQC